MQGGLVSGFTHPLFGWDHVVAMVAVGLWGVFLGRPAIWILPVVFPLVMAFGGAMGVAGLPLPAVEMGIALSGVILGLLVAFGARAPLWRRWPWSAASRSSTATHMAPSFLTPRAPMPTPWVSSSRPAFFTLRASPSARSRTDRRTPYADPDSGPRHRGLRAAFLTGVA